MNGENKFFYLMVGITCCLLIVVVGWVVVAKNNFNNLKSDSTKINISQQVNAEISEIFGGVKQIIQEIN